MAINERNYVGYAISSRTGRPHAPRHLPLMAEWEPGVYMYEPGDKFVADIDGIDNLPAQQLANRTEFLREQNVLLAAACKGLVAVVRETTVGKTAINGYPVALSRDRPGKPCAWVRPADDIGSIEESPVYVTDKEGNSWQNAVAKIVTEEGAACFVGGNGTDFPRIITVIGSVTLTLSPADPLQRVAWVRTEGGTGRLDLASSEVVMEDGSKILNPTAQVVSDRDDAYYVQTYAPDTEPLYEEVVEISGFEIATHGDIDAMMSR